MSSIHVAMIIQSYLPRLGGAERQLNALIPLLRERDIKCTVLTRKYPGMESFEEINGSPVHRLPAPGPKISASLSYTFSSLWMLGQLKPDIVHAHELLSPTTIAVSAKKLFGSPVVAKVLRGGMLGDLSKLQNRLFGKQRIQQFRKEVDCFISISSEISAELQSMGVLPKKCAFIPNGVDTDRFFSLVKEEKIRLRQTLSIGSGPMIVYSGRLVPEKRVAMLLEIWPGVKEQIPNAQLYILGSGEEEQKLKEKSVQGVKFKGYQEDIVPYLQAADVFVLPSATEGLSNALLEAMACGLTPIATKVGGAPDVIDSEHNGLLVEADNPAELRNALIQVLGDPLSSVSMGIKAREKIKKDYSLVKTAYQLGLLYESVLGRKRI
ncbi:MAG: glycosyltransferase family 4 protein [Anaerolineaceae bacterium]|nr:glycosyltransferase family 4 protein [Anaerolineaceae bacterium]